MHIPDGFINVPVSIGTAVVTAGAVGYALKRAKGTIEQEVAPMAGLAAVFIFAAQMLNFPVAAGTSGHLMGGALAAILIGPWAGLLAVTVVLVLQALIFADGGISAIGLNVFNIGVITVLVGWVVFRALLKVLPRSRSSILAATAVSAFLTVPASAMGFVVQYALGGTGTFELSTVLGAMLSIHVLIGFGEAAITALTVGAVLATRPDLVYGARDFMDSKKLIVKEV